MKDWQGRQRPPIDVWGGIECTLNRVGSSYIDQLEMSGHYTRRDDLERIAGLGVSRLRYPVLWERTAPEGIARANWSWADRQMRKLRELDVEPIVTLLHHGSGPAHTDLLDDAFPAKLAAYARAVAERYPWVTYYTPVNEPLTTARFSGLYGHWYPHRNDMVSFFNALRNQCLGTALAMQAIRDVNPEARLVVTEEVGPVHSTPHMAYQAAFENERRWLSLDLLTGRVDRTHHLWSYLEWLGVAETEPGPLLDEPCQPDIIGLNYYLTSERFLDERLDRYPDTTHGSNGRDTYADVEAVRVRAEGIDGLPRLLREAWDRYGLPLAVTEVHLGGECADQIRWLAAAWDDAVLARAQGVDVRAITPWALLGSFDWHCLVTRSDGHYEPSAFDVRQSPVSETPLANAIRLTCQGKLPLGRETRPGWWQTDERLAYLPVHTG